jgi:hypothetical protein
LCLGGNDREVSNGEFIAADGVFDGDGRFHCSYKNLGKDVITIIYNLTWHEVRTAVKNSYARISV